MLEILASPIVLRALAAALLASTVSAILGVFMVLRRTSAMGAAVAHMSFAGAMWGLATGVHPLVGAFLFSASIAVADSYARVRRPEQTEAIVSASIGVSSAMAALALAFSREYSSVAFTYLAGDVLGVSTAEVVNLASAAALVILVIAVLYKGIKYSSLDPETAEAMGMRTWLYEYALGVAVSLLLVFEMKAVGMILAQVYLVAPAATAWELAYSVEGMLLAATITSAISVAAGFTLALAFNMPMSAVIGLAAATIYVATLVASPKRRGHRLELPTRRGRKA